jgi:hypothetical protein
MREVAQEAAAVNPRPLAKDASTTAHEERTLFFSPGKPRLVELAAERTERGFNYYAIARRHHSPRFRTAR